MKRILFFFPFFILSFSLMRAQEMLIKSMTAYPSEQVAQIEPFYDLNGEPCALVRVELPLDDVFFDGNIVGSVERHVNEYLVYMTAGSKTLEIKHPKFYTLEVSFLDYDIQSLEGLQTYKLIVKVPQMIEQEIMMIETIDEAKANLENGHEYVDLGLPSGTMWATCNVGASTPEEFGDFFAWGAIKPQEVYDYEHAPYQTKKPSAYSSTSKWSKYLGSTTSSNKARKTSDSDAKKTVLDPEDDVAPINWGGSWHMPTKEELEELSDPQNCTWNWTAQNGINGCKVTSKKNNHSIFLPAAGCYVGRGHSRPGSDGSYYTSSLDTNDPGFAIVLNFGPFKMFIDSRYRGGGSSVRPVFSSTK